MASFVVTRALKRLGSDLKNARRRRRIKAALMAERVGVTRTTLDRMEKGSPTVGMGIYATAIYSLAPEKLEALATIFTDDTLGQAILDRDLPKRIRGRSAL